MKKENHREGGNVLVTCLTVCLPKTGFLI